MTKFILLLPVLLLGWLTSPVVAQSRPAQNGGPPDVLILVAETSSGQDEIGITYAKTVPHAQARRDVAALATATGWAIKRVTITDAPSSLAWDKAKMTGVECYAGQVVRPSTHGLTVQPFVQAFRAYPHVMLTYFVGDGFPFEGLHDYADDNVRITLERHGAAFTYQILIRNPRLERLNLPYLQPATMDAQADPAVPKPHARPWLLALVAIAAVGAGGLVYALLSRAA